MRKKIIYFLSMIFFAFLCLINSTTLVKADINGVTVTPLIEDDTTDVTDRFEIVGKPNAERTVKISISNFSINKLQLRIEPTNATTSMDGKIVYTDKVREGEFGLKHAFSKMTKAKTITLLPNKTKDVTFKIKLPDEKIDGLIMGGFNVYDTAKNGAKGNANVPVWITGDNKAVGGVVTLHNLALDVIDKKPHIIINLQNKEPGQMKNVIVHMTVKRKSWLDRFNLGPDKMTADLTYGKVAPNSKIPVDFDQNQTPIKAGKYVVKGAARSGKATWTFKKTYTITQEQANDINSRCKGLIYNKTTTYILIVCVLVSLIFLIFWAIWYSGRS
ncbi:WxL protein peptidoglycan domain-containing protein [Companilactobacillus sp. HBUAS59544]|uniref:WxL protein peptidoglycan domain-containing protein n=1 Tax=Companilactobacillus sp. HBUAS59544 TaxID=3109363 RepID=UPI002FF07AD9